jgi:hypothetical protein
MITPKRYTIDNNGALVEDASGTLVKYESYVELIAHAIEGASNREFLEQQVPGLKKALVKILTLASGSTIEDAADGMDEIVDISSAALSQ